MTAQAPANFNPRSPRGGATLADGRLTGTGGISIHAPHEGERLLLPRLIFRKNHFNPRSPRGGATVSASAVIASFPQISIHAPHEGERRDL